MVGLIFLVANHYAGRKELRQKLSDAALVQPAAAQAPAASLRIRGMPSGGATGSDGFSGCFG